MSGIRKCSKCGELMKIQDEGPETIPVPIRLCKKCKEG